MDASLVHLCNLTLRDGTRFEAVSPDVTEPKTSLSFQYMSLKFEPETTVRYSQVISSRKLTGCIGASSPARILQLNPHAIIHKASHDITRHLEYPHISHMLLSTTNGDAPGRPRFCSEASQVFGPFTARQADKRCTMQAPRSRWRRMLGHSQAPRVATRPRGCHAMPARLGRVCLVEPNLLKRSKLIQIYSKLLKLGFERSYTSVWTGTCTRRSHVQVFSSEDLHVAPSPTRMAGLEGSSSSSRRHGANPVRNLIKYPNDWKM